MAVVTVRPDATPTGAGNFTIYGGAASINAALADDSDATYIVKSAAGNGAVMVGFASTTLSTSVRVKQVRIRSKVDCPTASSRLRISPVVRIDGVNHIGSAQVFNGIFASGIYDGGYFTTAPDGEAWDQDRIDGLRAQISDLASGGDLSQIIELYFDIETTTQPTVTVASPTGTITTQSNPEVSWTYADADGTEQDFYRIKVFTAAQYGAAGFDPVSSTATWDSGSIASSDNTATIGDYLADGTTFRAYVAVAKNVSGVPFWSAYAYSQFTINTTPPTTPTTSGVFNTNTNAVVLTLTGATVSGSFDSQVFQVQRSDDSSASWADVTGGSELIPNGSGEGTLFDYSAPRAATALYRCRAIGTLSGDQVASAWSSTASVAVTNDSAWWLKPVSDPTMNVGSVRVQSGFDSSVTEQAGVFRPIGRANAVVVSAGLQGEDGSLNISTVSMSEFTDVWAAVTHTGSVLLQSPDTSQKYVRFTERSFQRGGTLAHPVTVISAQYVETDT